VACSGGVPVFPAIFFIALIAGAPFISIGVKSHRARLRDQRIAFPSSSCRYRIRRVARRNNRIPLLSLAAALT